MEGEQRKEWTEEEKRAWKAKKDAEFGVNSRRVMIDLDLTWLFNEKDLYKKYLKKLETKEGNTKIMLPLTFKLYGEGATKMKILKEDHEKNYILVQPGYMYVDTQKGEKPIYMGWTTTREFQNIPQAQEPSINAQLPATEGVMSVKEFDNYGNDDDVIAHATANF